MTTSDSRPPRHSSPLLRDLIRRATDVDGSPPFSDGALVELAAGTRTLLWLGPAAALTTATSAEFVVDPDARAQGHGTRMLEALLADHDMLFWAHGDHPAARALAASHGLQPVRELLHLAAPVPAVAHPAPAPRDSLLRSSGPTSTDSAPKPALGSENSGEANDPAPSGGGVRAFKPGDADAWLALNARAFAHHPEQGRMSRGDLDSVMAEPWFDPDDFLLLWDSTALIGYSWMKVVDGEGEFYVVGVDPDRQGEGLGRRLVQAGFARLESRGIRTAHLYVEGDNAPALALYRAFGFAQRSVDIQYRSRAR